MVSALDSGSNGPGYLEEFETNAYHQVKDDVKYMHYHIVR